MKRHLKFVCSVVLLLCVLCGPLATISLAAPVQSWSYIEYSLVASWYGDGNNDYASEIPNSGFVYSTNNRHYFDDMIAV